MRSPSETECGGGDAEREKQTDPQSIHVNAPKMDRVVRLVVFSFYAVLLAGWSILAFGDLKASHRAGQFGYDQRMGAASQSLRNVCSREITNYVFQSAGEPSFVELEQRFDLWRDTLEQEYEAEFKLYEERKKRQRSDDVVGFYLVHIPPLTPDSAIHRCETAIRSFVSSQSFAAQSRRGSMVEALGRLLMLGVLVAGIGFAFFRAIDWHQRTHGLLSRKWQRGFLASVPIWWVSVLFVAHPKHLIWGSFFLVWGMVVPFVSYVLTWLSVRYVIPWIKEGR